MKLKDADLEMFCSSDFSEHEEVVHISDRASGLKAIIAVHSTILGPAIGGCRLLPYASDAEALRDVLRLSRGMTHKAAIANVPFGGGKMVVLLDSNTRKTPEFMHAIGRAIDRLGGRYITGEDVGTTSEDMAEIRKATNYVMGAPLEDGGSGDPSPRTALGCFVGIQAGLEHRLGVRQLQGVRIAVQGLGNVGGHLCALLHSAGAKLFVSDVQPARLERAVTEWDAVPVDPGEIHRCAAEVFAPCALGAVLNDTTIPEIQASVVAGAANNQLEVESRHGALLRDRDILYAPDYAINSGGMIQLAVERANADPADVEPRVRAIGDTLKSIFLRAGTDGVPTSVAADGLARERLETAERSKAA